jgi:hypothetical protein
MLVIDVVCTRQRSCIQRPRWRSTEILWMDVVTNEYFSAQKSDTRWMLPRVQEKLSGRRSKN